MLKRLIKCLLKPFKGRLEFRRFRRLQEARATSVAVNMALTGALRKHA
jgi:hypothetical protein